MVIIGTGLLLGLLITYGVLSDANSRDWSKQTTGPLFWGLLTLLLWPAFLPFYLLVRPRQDAAPGWYPDVRKEAPPVTNL
ncbi:MAG: hypothetical protein QOJ29_1946 [Thermoleophilaceae bacterium]|nr:hypothetical protein [Thermoleophilaceae bacterium]